jgi:predicted nucleic acid-binding protein
MMNGWSVVGNSGIASGLMTRQELLFDSTGLVDLYRGQVVLQPYLEALINRDISAYISVITEAELWRGLRADEVQRHETLLAFFTRLPLHSTAARQAGTWMQRYASRGLGWMDALIVATAHQAGLTVLTRDLRLARCLGGEATFQTYTSS